MHISRSWWAPSGQCGWGAAPYGAGDYPAPMLCYSLIFVFSVSASRSSRWRSGLRNPYDLFSMLEAQEELSWSIMLRRICITFLKELGFLFCNKVTALLWRNQEVLHLDVWLEVLRPSIWRGHLCGAKRRRYDACHIAVTKQTIAGSCHGALYQRALLSNMCTIVMLLSRTWS